MLPIAVFLPPSRVSHVQAGEFLGLAMRRGPDSPFVFTCKFETRRISPCCHPSQVGGGDEVVAHGQAPARGQALDKQVVRVLMRTRLLWL